jgi:hypothetical protein
MSAKEKEAAANRHRRFIDYFMNNIEKNRIEEYGQNII